MSQASRCLVALFAALVVLGAPGCSRDDPAPTVVATTTPPRPPAPPPLPIPSPPPAIPKELPPDATALSREDRDFLVARGLVNPEAELIADLRAHPELIPCKGQAGGTPGFHDPETIRILTRDTAEAGFDDGHDTGRLDLGFTVRAGKIHWKVGKTECAH
jgi:hypothetical protein